MNGVAGSPFKTLYSSEKQVDGSIRLTYKKKNLWFGPFMAFIVSIFGAGLFSGIANLLTFGWLESSLGLHLLIALVGGSVTFYILAKNFFWLEQHIVIKPGESITANKKTFPVKELDQMWVQRSPDGQHYGVVVSGHGQEFALTGSLGSESLAGAIQKEIQSNLFKPS